MMFTRSLRRKTIDIRMSSSHLTSRIVKEFELASMNPVLVGDLLIKLALESGKITLIIKKGKICLIWGPDKHELMISADALKLRSVLGRIGNSCREASQFKNNHWFYRFRKGVIRICCGKVVISDASWLDIPGSPSYNLDGRMLIRRSWNAEACIIIKMENTGRIQHLSMVYGG